jgi:hypothetical protein
MVPVVFVHAHLDETPPMCRRICVVFHVHLVILFISVLAMAVNFICRLCGRGMDANGRAACQRNEMGGGKKGKVK